jgi:4-hydroxybenzoate polyprenyltransferase/predicted HAD superfamily phosphohydrolase YqeG
MKSIYDLNVSELVRGRNVIIDIDATLVPDKSEVLPQKARDLLRTMAQAAQVVFLSSNGSAERTKRFANESGVQVLVGARKPWLRLPKEFPTGEIIVIGDKWITDGLLAARIGASFMQVARERNNEEQFLTRLAFSFDDLCRQMTAYVRLMRASQWLKNGLVFAPIFFAGAIFNLQSLFATGLAFLSFCFLASGAYVVNDIVDRVADAAHPIKRLRPIPAGDVTPVVAATFAILLFVIAGVVALLVPVTIPFLVVYLIINGVYSLRLKHVVGVDVVLVAFSHTLRVVAGGAAAAVFVSPWILLCTFFGALFLVVGKRRGELRHASKRRVLLSYTPQALDAMLISSLGLAIAAYSVYTIIGTHYEYMQYSIVLVVIALLRVLNVLMSDGPIVEFPERLVIRDRIILASFITWVLYVGAVVYLQH